MTENEINLRIQELEKALEAHPHHPNRVEIETDLRNLRQRLEYEDYE
jgi:hypothetical protein